MAALLRSLRTKSRNPNKGRAQALVVRCAKEGAPDSQNLNEVPSKYGLWQLYR